MNSCWPRVVACRLAVYLNYMKMHLPAAVSRFKPREQTRKRDGGRGGKVKKKECKETKGIYDVGTFAWAARYRIYNKNERTRSHFVTFCSLKLLKNILI